jgi:hypothetical protein
VQLALTCNHDGSPSRYVATWTDLEHRTGYSRRAVAKGLREVEGLEEVTPDHRGGGRGKATCNPGSGAPHGRDRRVRGAAVLMADDDLRPGQVAKLTTTPPLPAELVDGVLDATDAERAAAVAELADRTREWLEQIGALKPSASVLDLDFRRLCALAGAFVTVEPWWKFPPYQQHSLGTMLKIVPADHARWAEWLLRWGGFLPPADPTESPEPGSRVGRQRRPRLLRTGGQRDRRR